MASNTTQIKNMKKRGQYVPSRYKEAAEKFSSQSSSSKDSLTTLKGGKDSKKLENTTMLLRTTHAQYDNSNLKIKECTSTPYTDTRMVLPSFDASAITNSSVFLDCKKTSIQQNKLSKAENQSSAVIPQRSKKASVRFNKGLAEAEIDLHYAQYLQVAFLESQAKMALKSRSECALKKIDKVWHLIQKYMFASKYSQKNVDFLSYCIKHHEHLIKQEEMLKNILEIFPTLENQYLTIANAVDSVNHKLHVKDVLLPDSSCEVLVVELLQKMEKSVKVFLQSIESFDKFISSVSVLQGLTNDSILIAEEIKSCRNLLTEAREMMLSEICFTLKQD